MMRMIPLAGLFAIALTAFSPAAFAAVQAEPDEAAVTLNRNVTVEGEIVTLGDIFSGLGDKAATAIARAPALGKKVPVGVRWLTAVAQKYALPWRPNSRLDSTVIQRASNVISTQRIKAQVQDALSDEGLQQDATLEFDTPSVQMILPREFDDSIRVTSVSYNSSNGRFSAQISAPAEGMAVTKTTVRGRAVRIIEVPVLRHRMDADDVIGHDDISWISHRADRLTRNALLEADAIVGKSLRRPIGPGLVLKAGELKTPEIVTKNGLVTIRVETDRMVLTAQGRALDTGAMGEAIRVLNTKSNTIISAEIIGYGTVRAMLSNHVVSN
jgi:flagella basal body P-ring formation protein FlgA